MDPKTAADFLAEEVVEQASLEGVSLSELEKRMMYSSGGGILNRELMEEFAAQHSLIVYEAKISTLLHHAYERLRKDEPEKTAWEHAIKALQNEDHYLSELWDILPASESSKRVSIVGVVIGVLIAVGLAIGVTFWVMMRHSH